MPTRRWSFAPSAACCSSWPSRRHRRRRPPHPAGSRCGTATGRSASCAWRRCSAFDTPPSGDRAAPMISSAAVLGAGAWGTTVALHLARRSDLAVRLWARDPGQAGAIAAARVNERYLPGVALPASLAVTSDLGAVADAGLLIVGTPIAALPALAGALAKA